MTARQVAAILERNGFNRKEGAKHSKFKPGNPPITVIVARGSGEIPPGTLLNMQKASRKPREEFGFR